MARIGLCLSPNMAITDALQAVKHAEERGYESAWVVESSLAPGADAISTLGALAISTKKIALATGVINIFSRSATLIASTMASLDLMSNGRMILGIGTGHAFTTHYHSVKFSDPLDRMREYIDVFRRLVAGERVNFIGKHLQITDLKLNLNPYRKRIPVYVATVSEKLARIAGEIADGVLFVLTSPLKVRELVKAAREGVARSGRQFEEFDIANYLPVFMVDDADNCMRAARRTLVHYGKSKFYRRLYRSMGYRKEADLLKEAWAKGDIENAELLLPERMVKDLLIIGSREECMGRINEYRIAGVKLPLIQPFYTPGNLESGVTPTIDTFTPWLR